MMAVEVAHADAPHQTFSYAVFHHLPGVLHAVFHRPVYQQEVDVFHFKLGEALVDGLSHSLTPLAHDVRRHFGGDEHLVSRHATVSDPHAYFLFILISLGGVDMAEAGLQGQAHVPSCCLAAQGPCADTNLRDFQIVA